MFIMAELLMYLKVFIFIFCCLNIIKNTYSFVKVLWTQSGKYDASQTTIICLGLSISYVLTCLIMGF